MSGFGDTFRALLQREGSRDAVTVQRVWREAKVTTGCQSPMCKGYPLHHAALDVAHIDATTKYRTRDGHTVEPADMVTSNGKGGTRYASDTIMREADKCRILCRNCHALETHRAPGFYSLREDGAIEYSPTMPKGFARVNHAKWQMTRDAGLLFH